MYHIAPLSAGNLHFSIGVFLHFITGADTPDAAEEAIVIPANNLEVQFAPDAVTKIIELTKGYPYFIQEMCSTIWVNHDTREISLETVGCNIAPTNAKLDAGFFQVRYERCTFMEKAFMAAMVKCGDLPCTIANVAKHMGNRPANSVSPFRSQLIHKGLIYATSHGEIDFTVPQFDAFIRRVHPDFQK